jgi:hypothetical protein
MTTALDPGCVFDRFVSGPENQVAAAAALRVAESPGRSYNPLVISGPAGVGKTHLLMAIGQRARVLDPELLVHYESGEAFVDRVTNSLSAGTLDAFREASAGIDVLLLDGLQEVAGKGRTEEELLRIAGELVGRGAQLVIAANAPLAELPGLAPALAARLVGGLNVEIGAPEEATRRIILARLVADHGFDVSDEVQSSLADLPIADVRELKGAVSHLVAAAELESRDISVEDVAKLSGVRLDAGPAEADEFDAFLSDISTAVAAVVETAPWRRRLAAAILRWEGEGIRTRRLEAALDADSAPDVEALLNAFGRDVGRLRHIARELPPGAVADPLLLRDPDRLQEAERLLAEGSRARPAGPSPSSGAARSGVAPPPQTVDRWFLDREKLAWDWLALDDRVAEEQR